MASRVIFQTLVFLITYVAYAAFHAVRRSLSTVKTSVVAEWTPASFSSNITLSAASRDTWFGHVLCASPAEAEELLGWLDAAFMFSYALGLYISGFVADRHDLRLVLGTGMCLTGVTTFVFGPVVEWLHAYNRAAYILLSIANGFFQATGWPCVVAVMSNWFDKNSRGLVLGLWSSCQSVGNIVGSLLSSSVVDNGYEYAFLLNAVLILASGCTVFCGLVPSPRHVGLPAVDEGDAQTNMGEKVMGLAEGKSQVTAEEGTEMHREKGAISMEALEKFASDQKEAEISQGEKLSNSTVKQQPPSTYVSATNDFAVSSSNHLSSATNNFLTSRNGVVAQVYTLNSEQTTHPEIEVEVEKTAEGEEEALGFIRALLLPGVIPYSLAYAFLKTVNYSFFFWLPFYLSNAFSWSSNTANDLSVWYDVGGIVCGTLAGFMSDRLQRRVLVLLPLLVLAIPTLAIYATLPSMGAMTVNAAILFVNGMLIGGAANLISAAITADLGRQEALQGNSRAMATVTGIVDGTGSLGAALGQVTLPYLQVGWGWHSVFYYLMAAVVVTIVFLLPILVNDVRDLLRKRGVVTESLQSSSKVTSDADISCELTCCE